MSKRVTLKDIAKRAGITPAAVSMALRDNPRIAPQTRTRVREIAAEIGYRSDALLSALSRHRHTPGKYATIAWLNAHKNPTQLMTVQYVREAWEGTVFRAKELGLKVEEFQLHTPGMTIERMNNILSSRQINGIIVAPLPPGQNSIRLQWDAFSAVALGHTLQDPILHSVAPNQYQQMRLLIASLRGLGYKRIGLYLDSRFDMRCDNHWQAAFWVDYNSVSTRLRIPLLAYEGWEKHNPSTFNKWIDRHKPEIIIIAGNIEKDFCLPDDIKVVYHTVFSNQRNRTGINENGFLVGATAVDTLIGMMSRNEYGIPKYPQRILIEGFWQPSNLQAAGSP